jgi:hypothetical protein
MKNIAAAFIKAKRAFGPVLKAKNNPAFKSKYANLEACLDAVDDACLVAGIALYQETFEDATGVTVETVFLHESGESLRCGKLHVPASKQDPQGYGSALTYARRYSILTACGIAAEDDDGNAASRQQQRQAEPANDAPKDTSPQATAQRIKVGVSSGDAAGAASVMADWDEARLNAVWALLDVATQDKLTAAWPKVAA